MLNKKDMNEAGFTLIEILVVVLIIGILASIAVPVFLNQRKKSLESQLRADMKTVATWMETNKIQDQAAEYPRLAKNWYAPNGNTTNYSNWPDDLKISENTGIITSDSGGSQAWFGGKAVPAGDGFCIEGQVRNSSFDLSADSPTKWRMYYNSLKGGFTNSCAL